MSKRRELGLDVSRSTDTWRCLVGCNISPWIVFQHATSHFANQIRGMLRKLRFHSLQVVAAPHSGPPRAMTFGDVVAFYSHNPYCSLFTLTNPTPTQDDFSYLQQLLVVARCY
jgi:hypothetical protein